jgi:hypothetical protein
MSFLRISDNKQKLWIFLESQSLNNFSLSNELEVRRILAHKNNDLFNFIRSTISAHSEILEGVSQTVTFSERKGFNIIQIKNKDKPATECPEITFGFSMEDIDIFSDKIFDKDRIDSDERNLVLMIFIHLTLIRYGVYRKNIFVFVTQNKDLLEHREWLEKKLGKLNIMTVQEAVRYMDLYAKHESKYYAGPNHTLNKDYWYWNSFRIKIPHYHVPTRENHESVHILEGFASRFKFLLLAIDEIGMQLYFPKDRDIMTPYHFNYFLSLVTGIFDNLAIETKSKYNISFDGDSNLMKISLNSKSGKDFLKEVKLKNPTLRMHIDTYDQFIELIFKLRHISIHREGFRDMAYKDSTGISFFFEIKKEKAIHVLIRSCGDAPSEYDKFSNWGMFDNEFFVFLEPYRFVIAVTDLLINFCDRYLEIMGFGNYIDSLSTGDQYKSELESFKESKLGF